MKRILTILALGVALGGALVERATAVTVGLTPANNSIYIGETVDIDLMVSGLVAGQAPSLGAYDITLGFDESIVSLLGVTFPAPPNSGMDFGNGSFQDALSMGPGMVLLSEVSFERARTLNRLQPDTFTLATLSFQGVAVGMSSVDYLSLLLSDENGQNQLPITALLTSHIEVKQRPTGVPEAGSSLALLLLASFGLLGMRGSRR